MENKLATQNNDQNDYQQPTEQKQKDTDLAKRM